MYLKIGYLTLLRKTYKDRSSLINNIKSQSCVKLEHDSNKLNFLWESSNFINPIHILTWKKNYLKIG